MAKHKHQNQTHSAEASLDELLGETTPEVVPPIAEPAHKSAAPKRSDLENAPGHKWEDFETAPADGSYVYLSPDGEGDGELCYARRSRVNVDFRWVQARVWSYVKTHIKIDFEPKYWRAR